MNLRLAILAASLAVAGGAGCATAPTAPPAEVRPAPPDAESLWSRAIADWEQGDDERALQGIQKLLAHHPDHLEGQRALVEMLLGAHEAEQTYAFLRERLAARPDRTGPKFALGYALGRSGDAALMEEGQRMLGPLARDQGDALVLEVLSDLLAALDRPIPAAAMSEKASRAHRRASEFDDERANLLKAGRYLHLAAEWDKAKETLGRALRQSEVVRSELGVVQSRQALGAAAQSLGALDEARRHYEAALKAAEALGHAGPEVSSIVNLAELLELQGDTDRVDGLFERLAAYQGEMPRLGAEVRQRRARILAGRGEGVAALDELSAAVETLKEEQAWQEIAEALSLAGRIHLEAGRWREAVAELAQAAQVWAAAVEQGADFGPLARAKVELAEALLDAGAAPDAAELFREARALAEEAGHGPLVRRAERGGLLCDLRMGTADDLKLALDRARSVGDPWVIAEALVGLGDWKAARAPAEAALSADEDPPQAQLPVRYALLVAVMLNGGDAVGAWAAYRAGTVAQLADRLAGAGIAPLHPPGRPLGADVAAFRAQVSAADALLDQALTPSVEASWVEQRRSLGRKRAELAARLAAADPAWASLMLHQASPARPPVPKDPGSAWVWVLPGEREALAFISTVDGVVAERLPALTEESAGAEFWKRIRAASPGAKRFVLSPPPELVHVAWHELDGAPPPSRVRYRPSAAPQPKPPLPGDAQPPSPSPPSPPELPADPLAVDLPKLMASHLHGKTLTFDAPPDTPSAPALDAVIRAALYAGADAVDVRTPEGSVLRYAR